jgi:hypothetical protein
MGFCGCRLPRQNLRGGAMPFETGWGNRRDVRTGSYPESSRRRIDLINRKFRRKSSTLTQGMLKKASLMVRMEAGWKPILSLRRRVAVVMVLPHDLELSLDAPKSNVA